MMPIECEDEPQSQEKIAMRNSCPWASLRNEQGGEKEGGGSAHTDPAGRYVPTKTAWFGRLGADAELPHET